MSRDAAMTVHAGIRKQLHGTDTEERWRLRITGVVQGVGFRPFLYRLAQEHKLTGWARNDAAGVCVEVQGSPAQLRRFSDELPRRIPPHASIASLFRERMPVAEESQFCIRASESTSQPSATVLPDLAPCDACLAELFDTGNRRYRYPFINCTHCGPRFSIVERLPYDRNNTSMRHFSQCSACLAEYADVANRRFHAEPNGCADCGPQLVLYDRSGAINARGNVAIHRAAAAIRRGEIVAVKAVGGFQLLVDAGNNAAVSTLRRRKRRPHKPFALMYPDLRQIKRDCETGSEAETLLNSRARPIVLLAARAGGQHRRHICAEVAPANPDLGVMLPSSPLHYLLMDALQRPVVATSGNLSGEPICTESSEALARLADIADVFLTHDRHIVRPLDDSVVRIMDGEPVMLRRARGYAPLPVSLPQPDSLSQIGEPKPQQDTRNQKCSGVPSELLAMGADLKSCVAGARGTSGFLGPHIGDLQYRRSQEQFQRSLADLSAFYRLRVPTLLCDLHPGYLSSRWAASICGDVRGVQHHVAHFFAAMAEHGHRAPAMGVVWDGGGYGEDGSIRGSEFLYWDGAGEVRRVASLLPFYLPGNERAVLEPRRSLLGLLHTALGEAAFSHDSVQGLFSKYELRNIQRMLERGIQSPRCSSIGRLFDGVTALLGFTGASETGAAMTFEGQAAMALEFSARSSDTDACYPFDVLRHGELRQLDWTPMLRGIAHDRALGVAPSTCAKKFHNTLVQMMVRTLLDVPAPVVFLSGGVFQNCNLVEQGAAALRRHGLTVCTHSAIPPNDGGIALGQLYYARCVETPAEPVGNRVAEEAGSDARNDVNRAEARPPCA